jgi:hypothetical protein
MAYLGNAPARSFISFERQVFTIVNSQTAYTLDHSVNNENDLRLVINNIVQEPGSGKAYTASGTTLTLSAALTNGTDEMYCVFLGRAVATNAPGAGSVGTSQLASDAVTAAKLNDDIISGQTALGATPADTDATAANLLDDYEEGTWTPSIDGTSIGAVGFYRKIGKICLVHFGNQTAAALALGDGSDYDISGLPFSMIASDWNYGSVPSASFADATASYYSQPLTGRQNNGGNIHIMNRSGVAVTSSDPVNVSMVYSTN